jgi:predicted PurR-regulated permease PerM
MDDQDKPPAPASIGGTVERGLALVLVAGVVFGVLATLRPFATAILFGAILAIALWPLRAMLVARGVGHGRAAALLLLLVIAAIVLPLLAVAPGLVSALETGATTARGMIAAAPATPPAWLLDLPLVGGWIGTNWARVASAQGEFGPLIAPYAGRIQAVLIDLATGLADSTVQMLLALVVATMLWNSGETIAESLSHGAVRLGGPTGAAALEAAGGAVRSVAYGVVGTSVLQGILAGIGFAIAGVPAAALLGFLTLIFSISQVLGPLVIVTWAGAAWWLFDQGNTGWAIFMAVWGATAVSSGDNVLRPLLIKRGVQMPLSLIILGVFGGFVAFGFLGLFIGPTMLAVGLVMLRAWQGTTPATQA